MDPLVTALEGMKCNSKFPCWGLMREGSKHPKNCRDERGSGGKKKSETLSEVPLPLCYAVANAVNSAHLARIAEEEQST